MFSLREPSTLMCKMIAKGGEAYFNIFLSLSLSCVCPVLLTICKRSHPSALYNNLTLQRKKIKKVMAHILGFGHKNQTNPPPTENGRKIKTK